MQDLFIINICFFSILLTNPSNLGKPDLIKFSRGKWYLFKKIKEDIENIKNENIKFLYIATEQEKDNAEKWMSEKNIKGEHIYISDNEWKQFEAMINFTAIPRESKNGKLIENNFNVEHFNGEQLKKLAERF